MMRHYLSRFGLALLVLFIVSTKFVDITIGAGFGCHPAETAWAATGLVADHFSMDYWVAAPTPFLEGSLEEFARKIGGRLGVEKPNVFAGKNDGVRFANLDGRIGRDGELVLTVQSDKTGTNLGISCSYGTLPPDLLGLERRIRTASAGTGPRGTFYWTIRAQHPGHLREEAWRAMWVRVLASINAVRRGQEPGEYVIEAYTPLLPAAHAGAGSGETNLVLVAQYDQARRVSMVALASPCLGEEI